MNPTGPLVALITVVSTLVGGFLALRLRHQARDIMAFTGGVVLGVALLDVLPEAADRLDSTSLLGILVGAGFLWFFVLSRLIVLHHRDEPEIAAGHPQVGALSAGALSFHSLQDGLALGAAFVVSPKLGIAIAIAVIGHDFADGMNTVTFVLSQRGEVSSARRWLATDAVAPLLGAIIGAFLVLSNFVAGVGLAVYCGIFLSIGTGELLPEAHSEPDAGRVGLTLLGFLLMLGITRLASL